MGPGATVPAGAHWLEAWQGAGSEPHRPPPSAGGEPAPLTLPALKPGRFGAGKEGLAKFTAGELESIRKLRNRKKLGS